MAKTRFTIEIDDIADGPNITSAPSSITSREGEEAKKRELTSAPADDEEIIEAEPPEQASVRPITIGRTFSDLVAEFKNDSRAMATILVILPFVVFIARIDAVKHISYIWYPVIASMILNAVWFGFPIVDHLFNRVKRIFNK